jgi:hypothetical protein
LYLIKGELGKPSSTYGAQSLVTQVETGKVVYTANGTFMLDPIKFLSSEFRRALYLKALWDKPDITSE